MFWRPEGKPAPSPRERKKGITQLYKLYSAVKEVDAHKKRLTFTVGTEQVCEAAFLNMLGYQLSFHASDAPSQWRAYKKGFLQDPEDVLKQGREESEAEFLKEAKETAPKIAKCIAWIHRKNGEVGSDSFATGEGATAKGELKRISVLPWPNVTAFYNEYRFEKELLKVLPHRIASRGTFRRAFLSLGNRYKLMGCKGNT